MSNNFNKVLKIYNSLPKAQQLLVAPRGRFIDSPNLLYRLLANKDKGFVELYKLPSEKNKAFLTVAVSPDSQGKGVGKQLVQKAIEEAKLRKDINSIIYKVDNNNIASSKLGASVGTLKNKTPDFTEYEIDTAGLENNKTVLDKVSPEKRALIKRIIEAYKDKYDTDLSYMKFEDSPVAYFNNGKKVGDDFNLPFGGSWTKKKKIYLNENMDEPMKAFNIKEDKDTFTSRIIAHELAHELYNNHATDAFKSEIADLIKTKKFTTPYLKTVNKDKLEEEAFAEYLADSLL